jgi:cation transport protein ChaC
LGLWVFGYGSLMWRPGFRYTRVEHARLTGFSRSFCVYSVHHRGSEARPGLVLGLDRGGTCEGLAYKVDEADVAETVAYLTAREQVNGVYREARLPVTLLNSKREQVVALSYIVERAHPSYASRLPLQVQARLIRGASGLSGDNITYALNTISHLNQLGIRERSLDRLAVLISPLVGARRIIADSGTASPRVRSLSSSVRNGFRITSQMRPGDRKRFGYRQKLSLD